MEFKKIAPNGRIQATIRQVLTISMANFRPVKVLSQERPGTTLTMARDLKAPSKKPPLHWVFEIGFI
jgi:hypothetical protein